VVRDGAVAVRDAFERVDDVPVVRREESEAVLAEQSRFVVRDGDAAGLPADAVVGLEDGHVEAALGEFVGRGQAADSSTNYRDGRRVGHRRYFGL
jgi:hypothetical protein